MKRLIIITDASSRLGMGHLIRQMTFARFLQKHDYSVEIYGVSELLAKRCKDEDMNFKIFDDWSKLMDSLILNQPDAVIIDVHETMFEQFRRLAKRSFKLILMVSEIGHDFSPFGDHLILVGSNMQKWNQTSESLGGTKVHSGRSWLFFREEFSKVDTVQKIPGRIVIAHGGTDPFQLTEFCLEAIQQCENYWSVDVLVTSQYKNLGKIQTLVKESRHKVEIHVDSERVAHQMAAASVGIINGGNVRYELCLTQTPFAAISFQPAQYICTKQLTDMGIGENCGLFTDLKFKELARCIDNLLLDSVKLSEMQKKMKSLFDFRGPNRVMDLL